MADVAGLVISVATAWKTCVQIFEIVDTSRKYGWDYEVLRIKLEVERVRLLVWGDAVGLAGLNNSQIIPDPRLRSREIQTMVMRVLGCIQNIFENSEALQNKYGLRPTSRSPASIFKSEYNTLLRSAKERQRSTNLTRKTLTRKTLWAVHDKRKFQSMVAEIKRFNENLKTLFPDVKIKAAETMRQDIGRSDQIQDLRLLQEVTAGEYEDVSESASVRLETLSTTLTDISDIVSHDDDTVIWGESDEEDDSGWAVGQGEGEEGREIPRPRKKEIVQLSKRLRGAVLFETMKNLGALRVSLRKPDDALGRASTHISWEGYPPVETWDPEDSCWAYKMTVLGTPHPSFGTTRLYAEQSE
ncbi:predicted protein [Aspergillus udagawae]|uniref:Prion-inhibition and propagation HeLo domain-containing protein n=1 Tax=Aspergillus udagawae TaxID=91492 RepID=A0A8H3NTT9_9EURO|nr:predicted protein [Aspergillus udagawae]